MHGAGVPRRRGPREAAKAFLTIAPNSFAVASADTAAAHALSHNAANSQSPREEPPEVVRSAPPKSRVDHRGSHISGGDRRRRLWFGHLG